MRFKELFYLLQLKVNSMRVVGVNLNIKLVSWIVNNKLKPLISSSRLRMHTLWIIVRCITTSKLLTG